MEIGIIGKGFVGNEISVGFESQGLIQQYVMM